MPAHSESPLDACFASVATFVHDEGEPETSATGISPQCAAPVTTLISHRPEHDHSDVDIERKAGVKSTFSWPYPLSRMHWLWFWTCGGILVYLAGVIFGAGIGGCKRQEDTSKPAVQAELKDPPKKFTNSIGMKFVWIPPGTFLMGSPREEKDRDVIETQHKVTLTKGFYMGVFTVTQEQWQTVMGNNPSRVKGVKNLPVENVSWEDCQEFIKEIHEKDKRPYRLPTEAEWEYACRAGTTTPFYFGESISTNQANCEFDQHVPLGKLMLEKTTPVGSFPHNAFGLYDMHGNVGQWCQDSCGNADYPQQDVVDPQGPAPWRFRAMRGGDCTLPPKSCRSAQRSWLEPSNRGIRCGFRLCCFME